LLHGLEHPRNEPAAAGHFEFAEDRVDALFYHRHTQMRCIGDFLVALSPADESGNFLFSRGEPGNCRQTPARGCV
jgi:hypothetical protein